MEAFKTLVDLSPSLDDVKSSDPARLFAMFAAEQKITLSGMLYSQDSNVFVRKRQISNRKDSIAQACYFFHDAFHHEIFFMVKLLQQFKLRRFFSKAKPQYDLHEIDKLYDEVMWRNVFKRYIDVGLYQSILSKKFYYTNMTARAVSQVKSVGYDFMVFTHVNAMRVLPETKKIIRLKDSVLLSNPDLSTPHETNQYLQKLHAASRDSYFVCETDAVYKQLLQIYPQLLSRACVIPSAVSFAYTDNHDFAIWNTLLQARSVVPLKLGLDDFCNYILCETDLSPKDNISALIHAWEKINFQYENKLRLVLVSKQDTVSAEARKTLQPHLAAGDILLLQNVTELERSSLYSNASIYAAVGFSEIAYNAVLAAIHYGCPVLLSGNQSLFLDAVFNCDAHAEDSIFNGIETILYREESEKLRADHQNKAEKKSALFTPERVCSQWLAYFADIKSKG